MKRILFLALSVLLILSGCDKTCEIVISSFNIRTSQAKDGANSWPNRKQIVLDFINESEISVIGLQEVTPEQYKFLSSNVLDYQMVGGGRLDGEKHGEATPILFDDERFKLLDHSMFWLSKAPQTPGSRAWESNMPINVTWVKLLEPQSGKRFYVFNTHFEPENAAVREKGSKLLLSQIGRIVKLDHCVLLGDFNCSPNTNLYQNITKNWQEVSPLKPVLEGFDKKGKNRFYTYNGFKTDKIKELQDYIFISSNIKAKAPKVHKIIKDDRFISDHFPISAKLKLTNRDNNYPQTPEKLSLPIIPP